MPETSIIDGEHVTIGNVDRQYFWLLATEGAKLSPIVVATTGVISCHRAVNIPSIAVGTVS